MKSMFRKETKRNAATEKGMEIVGLTQPWKEAIRSAVTWRVPVFLGQDPGDEQAIDTIGKPEKGFKGKGAPGLLAP